MPTSQAASAPATRFWLERGPHDWARILPTYWEAGTQLHRQGLIAALRTLPRFESVRELGCCAGTNIKLIRDAFPHVIVQGVEVSQEATLYAQDKFVRDGHVGIVCSDILDAAAAWEPKDADVVISCYTLAYIAPDDLPDVLEAIIRSARIGVVLVEPMMGEPGSIQVPGGIVEWRHDYVNCLSRILTADSREARLECAQLPKPVELCDGVITVTFVPPTVGGIS